MSKKEIINSICKELHDINNQQTIIVGNMDLILLSELPEECIKRFVRMTRAVEKTSKLIRNCFDIANNQ